MVRVTRRGMTMGLAAAIGVVVIGIGGGEARAESQPFSQWLDEFRRDALSQGIRQETLDAAFEGIEPIPRVIELDRRQPEFTLTFQQYMERVVPQTRVEKGRRMLAENRALLDEVGGKYGIEPRFLVAFWGVETDFGRVKGGFQVVPALATLAHDGRRSAYFRKELVNALKIIDQGHVKPADMTGSWAGAMGQCQFMPSSFLNFAVDHNGDGRKDLWNDKADVFASAANYLTRSGWKNDQTWGRPVELPTGFDPALAGPKIRKSLAEWSTLGVRRAGGGALPGRDLQASIVFTEGPGSAAYLVYDNFETILKWNRSVFFAVAVGSLADRIKGG
ncbi:MAG: lytic murein transglycosylase [Rhodospirillales bacterium]|nr:lytic murein transglycosylase [Rhodospirillales bacterium]